MSLYAMKHENCPTCHCTDSVSVGTKGHVDWATEVTKQIPLQLIDEIIEDLNRHKALMNIYEPFDSQLEEIRTGQLIAKLKEL